MKVNTTYWLVSHSCAAHPTSSIHLTKNKHNLCSSVINSNKSPNFTMSENGTI